MQAQRIHVKLYAETDEALDPTRLIPAFHRWIQAGVLADDMPIDVADYRHVPSGPGVLLIAHHANYAYDYIDGEEGMLYARKRDGEGSFAERLRDAVRRTLFAAKTLAAEPALRKTGLRFPGDRLAVRIQDRLLAPNNAETLAAVEPVLRELLGELYGDAEFELIHEDDPRSAFGIRVKASTAPGAASLLERIEAAAVNG